MMKSKSKGKSFILLVVLLLFTLGLAYYLLIDKFVIHQRLLPYATYKQFLLENTADLENKIVILSGSSAYHGINAHQLETYFNRPVINLAENAGFPVQHYLAGMHDYLNTGDILILPLEWSYYSLPSSTTSNHYDSFVTNWLGTNAYFYRGLPLIDKIIYNFTDLSIDSVLKAVLKKRPAPVLYIDGELNTIRKVHEIVNSQDPLKLRGSSSLNHTEIPEIMYEYKSCADYILSLQIRSGFEITDNFKNILDEIVQFKRNGIKIIFIPPTVVSLLGDKCYSEKTIKDLDSFVEKIRTAVNEYTYTGNYRDFEYKPECFLDTNYHIKSSCTKENTSKTIEILKEHITINEGILGSDPLKVFLRHRLESDISKYLSSVHRDHEEFAIKKYSIHSQAITLEGWSILENWGVWSEGRHSSVLFLITSNDRDYRISFEGQYFGNQEATSIFVNENYIDDKVLTKATINIPKVYLKTGINYLNLVHHETVKLSDIYPDNSDKRDLKFGLQSLVVKPHEPDIFPETKVTGINLSNYIFFTTGWSVQETWGIWSEGKESRFSIKSNPARKLKAIHINGHYFEEREFTDIKINGLNLGKFILENQTINIPEELNNENSFFITLKHKNPLSPSEVSAENSDTRKIKYALEGLKLVYYD